MNHFSTPKITLTRQQRQDAGQALRTRCSRKSQETWRPASNRPDPISVLVQTSKGRIPHLLPIRYGRMMQSPFAFYRGAAAIMAGDLAHTPRSSITVQVCGDCHLMNFGLYATPERRLIFDISDFDETVPAPWEWDVKRLAASFVIAAQHIRFSKRDARDVAERLVRSYRLHIADFSEMRVLERWYERLDADELVDEIRSKKWKRLVRKRIAKEVGQSIVEHDFPKLAYMRNGRARIQTTRRSSFIRPPLARRPMTRWSARLPAHARRWQTIAGPARAFRNPGPRGEGRRRGQRRHPLCGPAPDGRRRRPAVPAGQGGAGACWSRIIESIYKNQGQRGRRRPAVDAVRERSFLGWTTEKQAGISTSANCATSRFAGDRDHDAKSDGQALPARLRLAPRARMRSRVTLDDCRVSRARAPVSTRPSRGLPSPTRSRTNAITRHCSMPSAPARSLPRSNWQRMLRKRLQWPCSFVQIHGKSFPHNVARPGHTFVRRRRFRSAAGAGNLLCWEGLFYRCVPFSS